MKFKEVIGLIFLIMITYIVPINVFGKTYNYPNDVRDLLYGSANQNVVEFLPFVIMCLLFIILAIKNVISIKKNY